MRITKKLFFFIFMVVIQLSVSAQQVNTLYFMKDVPVRHFLNPSFQPTNDFYISLPVIGFTQFGIGNNSLTLSDLLYKSNGQTITFLNTQNEIDRFYKKLNVNTIFRTDFQTNLLSFGCRRNESYWTFSLTEKADAMISLPKDAFKLTFYGTPNIQSNSFNIKTLQTDVSVYTEAALGYSKKLDEKWIIGGKLKLLIGSANFSTNNSQMKLQAGIDNWTLKGSGSANLSSPIPVTIGPNFQSFSYLLPTTVAGWLIPSGLGAGLDIGAQYQLNNSLSLSASLLDLGFVNWTKNVQNNLYNIDYTFDGLNKFDSNSTIKSIIDAYNQFTSGVLTDSVLKKLQSSVTSNLKTSSYITGTTAKLNLGVEYSLLNHKLSFGLLSHSRIFKKIITEELTASTNARPYRWLNGSLSYSVFNGRLNSIGAGIGIKTGIVHWFVAADYLPFSKVTFTLSELGFNSKNGSVAMPYKSTTYNLAFGVNLVFDTHVSKIKSRKIDIAEKLGLRNSNPKVTRKDAVILPDKKKISKNRTQIDSSGHNKKKSDPDCHCDWK